MIHLTDRHGKAFYMDHNSKTTQPEPPVSKNVANSPWAQGPAASVIAPLRKGRPPVLDTIPVLDTSNDAALARALADEIKARMLTFADARI